MLSVFKSFADLPLLGRLSFSYSFRRPPLCRAVRPRSKEMRKTFTTSNGLLKAGGVGAGHHTRAGRFIGYNAASADMKWYGRIYGIILHLQLIADVFPRRPPHAAHILAPKAGAVALAAYRECWRQPMFWLIMMVGSRPPGWRSRCRILPSATTTK